MKGRKDPVAEKQAAKRRRKCIWKDASRSYIYYIYYINYICICIIAYNIAFRGRLGGRACALRKISVSVSVSISVSVQAGSV